MREMHKPVFSDPRPWMLWHTLTCQKRSFVYQMSNLSRVSYVNKKTTACNVLFIIALGVHRFSLNCLRSSSTLKHDIFDQHCCFIH